MKPRRLPFVVEIAPPTNVGPPGHVPAWEMPRASQPEIKAEHKLTPEQIENWRNVLFLQLGSYALIMPAEEIQWLRDKMAAE